MASPQHTPNGAKGGGPLSSFSEDTMDEPGNLFAPDDTDECNGDSEMYSISGKVFIFHCIGMLSCLSLRYKL